MRFFLFALVFTFALNATHTIKHRSLTTQTPLSRAEIAQAEKNKFAYDLANMCDRHEERHLGCLSENELKALGRLDELKKSSQTQEEFDIIAWEAFKSLSQSDIHKLAGGCSIAEFSGIVRKN